MRQLIAFTRKEFMELARTGKILILGILFILFGIMNPAVAKLTPWLMKIMDESLSEAGLAVTQAEVNAFTSWAQFYKNLPVALIIFLLIFSNNLTSEYQRGTLINMVTKGLERWKIIVSKTIVTAVMWTAGYWTCYGITYGYNGYFWENHIASHLFFSAFCFYLSGLWLISLVLLMSSFLRSSSAVIAGTGGIFLAAYLAGLLPDIKRYLPVQLTYSSNLLTGAGEISEYAYAVMITIILIILNIAAAIIYFNKRAL